MLWNRLYYKTLSQSHYVSNAYCRRSPQHTGCYLAHISTSSIHRPAGMGVDHGGNRGGRADESPIICSGGTLMQIVPPILSYRYTNERSVAFKIRQNPFWPRWGSSRRSPKPHSRLKRGHPSPYPTLLARTHLRRSPYASPQKSSQIYAYAGWITLVVSFVHFSMTHFWHDPKPVVSAKPRWQHSTYRAATSSFCDFAPLYDSPAPGVTYSTIMYYYCFDVKLLCTMFT